MTTHGAWMFLTLCLIADPAGGQWPTDPMVKVAVRNAGGSQPDNGLIAVPSINGGTIASWQDDRDSDNNIYAQRLSSIGETQWLDHGVPVCTAAGNQLALQLVP
jgi:hypothetical protein